MLKKRLQDEQLTALKSQEKARLEVIRYILAQLANKEIEKQKELTEEDETAVLKKVAKELKEALESAQKAQRQDLVEQNQNQLKIVEEFLPEEMSEEHLKEEIKKVIDKNKETYEQNKKAIIGIVMGELRAKADPQKIMQILQAEYL